MMVLLRNSARDGRKGDKLAQRWLGPYKIKDAFGKNMYALTNSQNGRDLKRVINECRYDICLLIIH